MGRPVARYTRWGRRPPDSTPARSIRRATTASSSRRRSDRPDSGRERILAQLPQHLGADDVADAGQHALVEQKLGHRPVDPARAAQVGGGVEPLAEQIGAEPEPQIAATPDLDPARAGDDDVGRRGAQDVRAAARAGRGQPHAAVHPQMHVQAAPVGAVHEQVLAARLDRRHVRPGERAGGDVLADHRADPARHEHERVALRHAAPAAGAPSGSRGQAAAARPRCPRSARRRCARGPAGARGPCR